MSLMFHHMTFSPPPPPSDSTHLRQNGLPDDIEPQTTNSEDYPIEPSSHVTNTAEQREGSLVREGRFSPQDMHKDNKSKLFFFCFVLLSVGFSF